jgi:hypothetical protein
MAPGPTNLLRANELKQDSHRGGKLHSAARDPGGALAADRKLLDELQTLLDRLGAAKVLLTLYLVEFGGLPPRLALPLLREAAGSCAMLRPPSEGQHLVIYLGPEPSLERGGFQGRLLV